QIIRRNVDDGAGRILGDHQRMPWSPRHDVEEREYFIVLEHFIGRQFAAKDFGEDIVWIIIRHCALQAASSVSAPVGQSPRLPSPPDQSGSRTKFLRNGANVASSAPAAAT